MKILFLIGLVILSLLALPPIYTAAGEALGKQDKELNNQQNGQIDEPFVVAINQPPSQPYHTSGSIKVGYPTTPITEEIQLVFGKSSHTALSIIACESGGSVLVISNTGDVGLFQINLAAHWDEINGTTRAEKIKALQDWHYNIQFAYKLFLRSGWDPWVCNGLI